MMVNRSKQNVFFIDDDPDVRCVVERILRESGVNVICFDDPIKCLIELRSKRCDLLITDLIMPDMDGIELLKEVRQYTPWVPVLMMSGFGNIPTAVKAIKAGAVDFIEKPLNKKSFVYKVKQMLQESISPNAHPSKPLTRMESRILGLVIEGKSSKEIAKVLYRSPRTIEGHRSNLKRKLGANNLLDILRRTMLMCLVDMSGNPELLKARNMLIS